MHFLELGTSGLPPIAFERKRVFPAPISLSHPFGKGRLSMVRTSNEPSIPREERETSPLETLGHYYWVPV